VEQLLVCALREVADGALGDAILEMGIDAAEGELLSGVVAGLLEGVVEESPIVAVVMLDSDRWIVEELWSPLKGVEETAELSFDATTNLEGSKVVRWRSSKRWGAVAMHRDAWLSIPMENESKSNRTAGSSKNSGAR
jgi:hypothetical protein